jgi:hypothetical protein
MADRFTQVVSTYGPKFMTEFRLDAVQVAGILGNLAHECLNFTQLQQVGCRPPRGGYGWPQWTGSRRRQFEGYCRTHRLAPASDEANYAYLCVELHGAYRSVIAALQRCTTVDSAAITWERRFEAAGKPMMSSRIAKARQALAILHPGHPAAVAPAPPPAVRRKPVSDKHRGHH